MSDLAVPNIICIQTQKQFATSPNFVDAKTSLHTRCVHARHRVHNLSNPEFNVYNLCYKTLVLKKICKTVKNCYFRILKEPFKVASRVHYETKKLF